MFSRPIHAVAVLSTAASLLLAFTSAACAKRTAAHIPPPPAAARIGSIETGVASWYGAPYDGRRAASGEIYNMEQPTAAHRTLPFDTWVEVTNLSNGKQTDVRINDRGPFAGGRIIDLSHAAAREIGMLGTGTARVRLKVIPSPAIPAPGESTSASPSPAPSFYVVQAGAFLDRTRAESLQASLAQVFGEARIARGPENPPLWRVLVGGPMTIDAAKQLAGQVARASRAEAVIVPQP